jgi:hypothetical protein
MKTLETLYFPDTAILSLRQLPLLLLFPTVHIVSSVEDDPQNQDAFMADSFCQYHTPYPLGEDRQRFLYLINDIQNRKDDYAAQLSHITLASMSEKQNTGESSKHQIVSSLLGRPQAANQDENNDRKDLLWQARLVLKIAEILDREEEEVARSLAFLDESETELFDRLKGEDDDEQDIAELYDDLKNVRAKLDSPRIDSVKKRLKAWFRFVEDAQLPDCPIWSTTRRETTDILFDNHEIEHGEQPLHLASLELPAVIDQTGKNLLTEIEHFHRVAQEQLPLMIRMIIDAADTIENDKSFMDARQQWQKQLDIAYPKEKSGRITVNFHLFSAQLSHYSGVNSSESSSIEAPKILATFAV